MSCTHIEGSLAEINKKGSIIVSKECEKSLKKRGCLCRPGKRGGKWERTRGEKVKLSERRGNRP